MRAAGKACPPSKEGDSETMRCEAFCREAHLDEHCDLCKCKACGFCPSRLDTLLSCPLPPPSDGSGDSKTLRCEPFCAMAHAKTHCSLCKCAACAFCLEDDGMISGGTTHANPLMGLNRSAQLYKIVAAANKRVEAAKPPPPPPPRPKVIDLGAGSSTTAATGKHGPISAAAAATIPLPPLPSHPHRHLHRLQPSVQSVPQTVMWLHPLISSLIRWRRTH